MQAEQAGEDADSARLVARFQAGDAEAFAAIYARYFDRVYGYLRVMLRNPHEAEDVAQQVFLQVFRALPAYEHRRSFWVWLFTVVRNQALKELRRLGRLEPEDPGELERTLEANGEAADPAPPSIAWLLDEQILMFIERLPLAQRQVLTLRYMLDLSNPQIAQILGRNTTDISRLHHRAIAFLRKRLLALGVEPKDIERSDWQRRTTRVQVLRARRHALTWRN